MTPDLRAAANPGGGTITSIPHVNDLYSLLTHCSMWSTDPVLPDLLIVLTQARILLQF